MSLVAEQQTLDGQVNEDDGPLLKRRSVIEDTEVDITPMIDITFLLLIFFLVASVPDPQVAIDLPSAVMGGKVDPQLSTFITIAVNPVDPDDAEIYLADGRQQSARVTRKSKGDASQKNEIVAVLREAVAQNKPHVIIKAEKDVRNGEVDRIIGYISGVEGIRPHLAVFEED
ncbi:MAG: biopolymer transporter ExbD [Pirellulales bacterium]|nr:biopolymer transporter ExbD [Pirellulales bacterium]